MTGRSTCIARSRGRASRAVPAPPAAPDLPSPVAVPSSAPLAVRRAAWLLPLAVAAALWSAAPASAQEGSAGPTGAAGGQQQPAVFTADEVTYDDALGVVVARGNVEVVQGDRTVRADVITYNRRTRVVAASGNVVLVEPGGDVLFANYAELEDDLRDGFVQNVSVLFVDNSRMIGTGGIRQGPITDLDRVVYSPCYVCADDPQEPPLWQLRAVRATRDEETLDITYRDAFLDMFGYPVLYTPYLSHPDPSVQRRTGFLAPSFGTTGQVGPFAHLRYYIDIAPEQDATAELIATRNQGFVLGGEYRRRFTAGSAVFSGSVNRSDREEIENGVTVTRPNAFRWSVNGNALYDIDENWRAGAVLRRVSDDTYLKSFDFAREDVLRSRGFAEGFYGLSYALAEVYSFQDLRADQIGQPDVVPLMGYSYVSQPDAALGGQVLFNAGFLQLARNRLDDPAQRQSDIQGVDTRRLSFDGVWQRELFSETGLVTNLSARVSGDLYWSDDVPDPANPNLTRDGVTARRLYPRATITASYPLVRQSGTSQQLIEPILSFSAAPWVENDGDIPNNDSRDVEFDIVNLFSDNRYPGRDRVDGGTRVTYGVRTGIFGYGGGFGTLFLGQSYRLADDSNAFPPGSGLDTQRSDVVGRLNLVPSPLLNLDWRFRLNQEDFAPRRNEVVASAGVPLLRVTGVYTSIDNADAAGTINSREEVVGFATSHFANYWTGSFGFRYDLTSEETRSIGAGLTYIDECFTFTTSITRDLTSDRDAKEGLTVLVTLAFRNIGAFPISLDAGGLLGSDTTTSAGATRR